MNLAMVDTYPDHFRVAAEPGDVPLASPVNVLLSFHYYRQIDIAEMQAWGLRIIGDSGAFSADTQGAQIDLDEYAAWVNRWRGSLLWAASLDVIGDAAASWINYRELTAGVEGGVSRLASPALTDSGPVPHGHYAAESMTQTVVQGRNLLFVSSLVARSRPGDVVAVGVHAGDHTIYPDCRPEFILPLREAIARAYDVDVVAPFLSSTKADIVVIGREHSAPMGLSWSCYEGGDVHCGRCGTCVERAEAFHLAGVPDPTVYADREFWKAATA